MKRDNFQLDALVAETLSCCSSFNEFEWNFGGNWFGATSCCSSGFRLFDIRDPCVDSVTGRRVCVQCTQNWVEGS